MDSKEDIDHIVIMLTTAPNDEYLCKFNEYHSKLFDNMRSDDMECSFKILETFQKYCEVLQKSDLSDERSLMYLSLVTPKLSLFISKSVGEIDKCLVTKDHPTESLPKITAGLQQITHILESFNLLLKSISTSSCQLTLEENSDFVLHFGSILLLIFQHCHNRETDYVDFPPSAKQHISTVFRKCEEILDHYIQIVQSLVVDCNDKDDVSRLIAVIDKIFFIGTAVSNFGPKTMALLWKGLLNFLKPYAIPLRREFDLSLIIEFLFKEITEKTNSLYENADAHYKTLTLKVSSFLLRIIVKLCDYWYENLETCMPCLLQLIFFLYSHSTAYSKYSKVNFKLIEEIDTSLLPAVDSLISGLINDYSFIRYFSLKNIQKIVNDQNETAALMLLCTILKKLISCNEDVQDLWFQHSILNVSLTMISEFHRTLFYEIKLPTSFYDNVTSSREFFLYDAILINMSTLIVCNFSDKLFEALEMTLITYLLRSPISVKIFISDLWCIIDRYGNSELCLNHVKYLLSVLKKLQCGKTEGVILVSLIKRLFKFLSPTHQIKLLEMAENNLLITDPLQEGSMSQNITRKALTEVKHLKRISNPTFEERIKLLKHVTVIQKCGTVLSDEEFDLWIKDSFIVEQWDVLVQMLPNLTHEDLNRTVDFIFYLCCVTSFHIVSLSPKNILLILRHANNLMCELNVMQLNAQKVLRACGHIRFNGNPFAEEFYTVLESLFKICLRSRNSIVRQFSLESFSYFSHITIHETMIQKIIANDSWLKENLALYLQKKLRKPNRGESMENFIHDLFVRTSKNDCSKKSKKYDDEYAPKKMKLDCSLIDKISEAEIVLNNLTKIVVSKDVLDANEKNKLRELLQHVDKLHKFV